MPMDYVRDMLKKNPLLIFREENNDVETGWKYERNSTFYVIPNNREYPEDKFVEFVESLFPKLTSTMIDIGEEEEFVAIVYFERVIGEAVTRLSYTDSRFKNREIIKPIYLRVIVRVFARPSSEMANFIQAINTGCDDFECF